MTNSKKPKGWVKEPVRHGLAAKGIKTGRKTGMKLGKFQPTLKQMEDLLVLTAMRAKTDEEYAQLLEAADNIGDMREDRRIMAAKEGEMSGPSGKMPIVDMRTKMPIQMNPKLVPMWNAIEDIDTVREALKKDNLFFRSLVDAKVELQRAVDNTAEGHIASAQKNLTIALGLIHDVSTSPDIWKQRRHLAPPMERAIAEVRRAKQKLGAV